jgi:hypothetical protein
MPGIKGPIIGIIISAVITFAMYTAAIERQAGEMREFGGAWPPLKNFIYSSGGKLGPTGSLVVGGSITLVMVGWLILNVRKRKQLSNKA